METNLKRITAVLGPTNTGKTHLAVEIMLKYGSGIIGFPLRLLAREIFDKCVKKIGHRKSGPYYWRRKNNSKITKVLYLYRGIHAPRYDGRFCCD